MDLFIINQHHSADIDSSWLSSLRACIDSIGQTVMVLTTPWRKARPLSRGWCLFELYCTIVTNSSFEVAMSKSQRDDFLSTLSLESTREALSIIDSANSKFSVDADRKVIREALINEVGFTELNTMVSLTILNWIIATTEAVITATEQSDDDDDDDDDLKLQLMHSLGSIYQHYGRYKLAEKCLTDEYAHRLCNSDRNHPDTEASMFNLARLYIEQGTYDKAESLYTSTVEELQVRLDTITVDHHYHYHHHHPDILTFMHRFASLYSNMKCYEKAKQLYEQCLSKRRDELGDTHVDTLATMCQLGLIYESLGQYDKAEGLLIECFDRSREALGDIHPYTLDVMHSLANVYIAENKWIKAESMSMDCLDRKRVRLGHDHPSTLRTALDVVLLHHIRGRKDKANSLYEDVLGKIEKFHPNQLLHTSCLASFYFLGGDYDKAESLFISCLPKLRVQFSDDYHYVLLTMHHMAVLYHIQMKYDEAEALYVNFLSKRQSILSSSYDLLLANIYLQQEKYEKAEPFLTKLITKKKEQIDNDRAILLDASKALAKMHMKVGRYEDAELIYLEQLAKERARLGNNHPSVLPIMNNLALLYLNQTNYDKAEPLFLECLAKMRVQ